MALAKNKNKNTLAGEAARASKEHNEVWIARGANRSSDNNTRKSPANKGSRKVTLKGASHS